jgi:transposase InsO family protein
MDHNVRKRLTWVEMYLDTRDAGYVCRRCGISRPTLRKWFQRYEKQGVDGLQELSRRPQHSPAQKVSSREEGWIIALRKERNLGARRIQSELFRLHECRLSLATIHKVLTRNEVKPLKRPKRKIGFKRYSRPTPGDRVQMDTMKLAPGLYQYTAVDDCTRFRVLALFKRRTAANTLIFLERLCEEMPFPIQRIQTDRGGEFFALKVQKRLMDWGIKFRPVKPASPHLNGKVERSQKTDLDEFYATADFSDPDLADRLDEWQHHYNWHRPHGSLGGKAPMDRFCELAEETPYSEDVSEKYDPTNEHIRDANYRVDLELQRLKRSV